MNGWETHFLRPIKFFGKSNSIRDNWTTVANSQVLLGCNAFPQEGDLFCTTPLIFSFKRSNDIRTSFIAHNLTLRWPYNFMFMFSRVNCLYSSNKLRRAVIPPIQISLKDLVMPPVVLIRRANAESGEFLLCAASQPILLFGFWKKIHTDLANFALRSSCRREFKQSVIPLPAHQVVLSLWLASWVQIINLEQDFA